METSQQEQRERLVDSGVFSYDDAHRMVPDGEPVSAEEAAQAYEPNPDFVPRSAGEQAGIDATSARGKAIVEQALSQMRDNREEI